MIVQGGGPPQHQSHLNVKAVGGLGITQIVLGILSFVLGIPAVVATSQYYWVSKSGSGIWFGLLIAITGIIGVCSSKQPTSKGLNGTNMAFNIFCTVISFIVGIFFAVGLSHFASCQELKPKYSSSYFYPYYNTINYERDLTCDNKIAGSVIHGILVLLMVVEFIISMIISVYCCQGTGCCHSQSTTGVIIHQPATVGYQVTSTGGQTIIATNSHTPYPGTAVPYNNNNDFNYPRQDHIVVSQQPIILTQPSTRSAPGQYPTTQPPQSQYPPLSQLPPPYSN